MVKGFKGKYFSLSAIQAYSTSVTLHAILTSTADYKTLHFAHEEQAIESPPDEACFDTLAMEPDSSSRPCHCNKIFQRRVKALWMRLLFFIQSVFEYSKITSGIAPPIAFFYDPQKHHY